LKSLYVETVARWSRYTFNDFNGLNDFNDFNVQRFQRFQFACRLLFLWLALAGIFPQAGNAQQWETVRWIDDGDTVVLDTGDRIRYIGINCPEIDHGDRPAEPFGDLAKRYNKELVYGKRVRIEYDLEKRDRHGRLLAYLFLGNGRFINGALVAEGLAYCLPHGENTKFRDALLAYQREAMSAKRGIWKDLKESGTGYVGNRISGRFHTRECILAKSISKRNRIHFKTKQDAFWNGFAPGKRCLGEYWKQ